MRKQAEILLLLLQDQKRGALLPNGRAEQNLKGRLSTPLLKLLGQHLLKMLGLRKISENVVAAAGVLVEATTLLEVSILDGCGFTG